MRKFRHYVKKHGHIEAEIWVYDRNDIRIRYPKYAPLRQAPMEGIKYTDFDQVVQFLLMLDRKECLRFLFQWYDHEDDLSECAVLLAFTKLRENHLFHGIYDETYKEEFKAKNEGAIKTFEKGRKTRKGY